MAHREALAGMLHHEFDQLVAAETDELARLTTRRDRLKHEQERLLQAHYADARAHLKEALTLLENCADIYARCDDANRRLCNQALFTKVCIEEDDNLRVEKNRPFEMLLDPEINADALNWARNADKARTQPSDSSGKSSSLVRGVELRGLEPLTPTLPVWCATSCAIAPNFVVPPCSRALAKLHHLGDTSQIARTPTRPVSGRRPTTQELLPPRMLSSQALPSRTPLTGLPSCSTVGVPT